MEAFMNFDAPWLVKLEASNWRPAWTCQCRRSPRLRDRLSER
jgi:hypothetical protein